MTDRTAARIRQLRSGNPVVLAQQPLRMLWIGLGALVFTALGVLMIILGVRQISTDESLVGAVLAIVFGLVTVAFFGGAGLGGLALIMVRPSRLVLDVEGFREEQRRHGKWHTRGRVSWDEISAFSTARTYAKWPAKGLRILTYHLTDQGIERIHSENQTHHSGARSGRRPPERIWMRHTFGSVRHLLPLFEAAHREFGATFPAR